jgi:hypothetical protein
MILTILVSLILGMAFGSFYYIYHFNDNVRFLRTKTAIISLVFATFFAVITLI